MLTLHFNDTELNVHEDDSSYVYEALMQKPQLILKFSLAEYVEFPVGTYCTISGKTYTLRTPANIKKNGERNIEYTLTMGTEQDLLGMYKMRNPVDHTLKWWLTAKPHEFLDYIVRNLNERMGADTWEVDRLATIDLPQKTVEFNHAYIDEALQDIANAFETEWEITETDGKKKISLHKVEYFKDENALTLEYGKGKGFLPGVGRTTNEDEQPIKRLYVQGGERNIDPSSYGSKVLLLPKSQVLEYNGRKYKTDEDGYYVERYYTDAEEQQRMASVAVMDDSIDCSEIYPSRVGEVTAVPTEQGEDSEGNDFTYYNISDKTIPNTLDYSKHVIKGEIPSIVFQTGMLAGKEFNIVTSEDGKLTGYVHGEPEESANIKMFKLVPQEYDGVMMPGGVYVPKARVEKDGKVVEEGDKYIVLGISMPQDYICNNEEQIGASWDMYREAARKLYEYEEQKFTFTGTLQGLWVKQHEKELDGRLVIGGYVNFKDDGFAKEGMMIRITGIKRFLHSPEAPEVELSNDTARETLSSQLRELSNGDVRIDSSASESLSYIKRMLSYYMKTSREELASKLSRKEVDTAEKLITFLQGLNVGSNGMDGAKASIDAEGVAKLVELFVTKGIKSNDFTEGFLGTGFCLENEEDGNGGTYSYLEVDKMLVRKVATFVQLLIQELKHVGGQIILTPASMKCSEVKEFENYYRCYFSKSDGERTVKNLFVVGDLARAQSFNVEEGMNEMATNTYYWREVVGAGDDYIDLSKTKCNTGSGVPSAGDEIVQLGNINDPERQTAIILSAFGNDAPSIKMFRGINSYALGKDFDGEPDKMFVCISRKDVTIKADHLYFGSEYKTVEEYVDNGVSTAKEELAVDIKAAQTAATEAQEAAEAAKKEANSSIQKFRDLESDDVITPFERYELRDEWSKAEDDYFSIIAQADTYGVDHSAFDTAYDNARLAFSKHTDFDHTPSDQNIKVDKNTYHYIEDYYTARKTMLNDIATALNGRMNEIAADAARAGHYVLDLDNDTGQVACDFDGRVTGGYPKTNARVYYGTELDEGWTFSGIFEGCKGNVDAKTGEVTVTAVSEDNATVTVSAEKSGKTTISAVFTIIKVRAGRDGNAGESAFTHIRYSKNADGSGMVNTPTDETIYIGVYTGTSREAPASPSSYQWSKFKGDKGERGEKGEPGTGITTITYTYCTTKTQDKPKPEQVTLSDIPKLDETNKYLWQKQVINFTEGDHDTTTITLIAVYGDKGADGTSVKIVDKYTQYMVTDSGTQKPAGGFWSADFPGDIGQGKYLWSRTIVEYSDGTQTETYSVAYNGENGADAVFYYIEPSVKVVTKKLQGESFTVLDPAKVRITRYKQVGSGKAVETTEKTLKYQCVGADGSPVTVTSGTYKEVDVTPNTTSIKFWLYDGTTVLDMEEVQVTADAVEVYKTVKQGIEEQEGRILAQVEETYSTKNEVTGELKAINTKMSEIEQTATNISLKVQEIWPDNIFPDGDFRYGTVANYEGQNCGYTGNASGLGGKTFYLAFNSGDSYVLMAKGQIKVTAGKTYTVVFKAYSKEGIVNDGGLTGVYFSSDAGLTYVGNFQPFNFTAKAGETKYHTYTAVAPVGAEYLILRFGAKDNSGRTMHVTDIMVFEGDLTSSPPTSFVPWKDGDLLATGIDIANRKITVTSDQFEIRNNEGKVTASVDKDGVLKVGSGEFSGYMKTVPQVLTNQVSVNVNRDLLKKGGFICMPIRNGYSEGTITLPSSGEYLGTHLYLYSGSGMNTTGATITYNGAEYKSLNVETSCTYVELVAIPSERDVANWEQYQKGLIEEIPDIVWLLLVPGGATFNTTSSGTSYILHIYRNN